jgi:hypothetical protein
MTMDELLKYLGRFVRKLPEIMQGASPAEIDAVERIVGRPLPRFYRDFLARLGRNAGGLSLGYDTDTRAVDVLDFYEKEIVPQRQRLPPDCIAIGVYGSPLDVCLECTSPDATRVLATEGALVCLVLAESLEKMLFQQVFENHEIPNFPHVARHAITNWDAHAYAAATGVTMQEPARDLARQLGFTPEWFSDAYTFCGRMDGAAIRINQYDERGPEVSIGAAVDAEAERMARLFAELLGLHKSRA